MAMAALCLTTPNRNMGARRTPGPRFCVGSEVAGSLTLRYEQPINLPASDEHLSLDI
jgi:hypothetical protein